MGPAGLARRPGVQLAGVLAALAAVNLTPAHALAQEQLHKLTASDGAEDDDFGSTLGISGDLVIVGAKGDDDAGTSSGSAYVFDVATGSETLKLMPSDARRFDFFGISVAISGERAVVGARLADPGSTYAGTVYVFDASTGLEHFKLVSADSGTYDQFGHSVAINGQLLIAGAVGHGHLGVDSGAAYVFDVTTGQQLLELLASDAAEGDAFGYSVSISGDRAIVGAPGVDTAGTSSGAAYVFDVTTGQELFKLLSTDILPGDWFGRSVAISDGMALVVSTQHPPHGAAYLFDVATGQQLFKLTPPGGGAFGLNAKVALSGDRALVWAHVYDVPTGQWLYTLWPSDGASGSWFGDSVALSGARALVGAPGDDDLGDDAGAAYLFAVPQSEGSAYCFGDGSGTTCACGNNAGPGEGCANSTGAGAILWAAGSPSASADELVLYASQVIPAQPALLFAGLNAIHNGDGWPLSDGLRCAGGGAVRLGIALPAADGTAIWGPGLAQQGGFAPGDLRRFQTWYRDPSGGPCGTGANLSNGLEISFTP